MATKTTSAFGQTSADADLLRHLLDKADRVFVKKLSNNDRDWARSSRKHQGGVYVSHELRDCGFFPSLDLIRRRKRNAPMIRQQYFTTLWPQVGGERKRSRLVHYTSKGEETHLTRLPKLRFADLQPASFLVIGRIALNRDRVYECLTIDSASDEAEVLADVLDLRPDFVMGVLDPAQRKQAELDHLLEFAEQVIESWCAGRIVAFAQHHASMPTTAELARMAQAAFLNERELRKLNPFTLDAPGDALRQISRHIEWDLFRRYQRRERSVQLVRLVLGDRPRNGKFTGPQLIRRLINELPAIDALLLSATQQRRSRAGYSYEHHIEAMLRGGGIPFEKQVVVEAQKRPDFILPSLSFINSRAKRAATGLILSAKTTLRERWKQVEHEKGGRRLFLTTVDENISGNAIEDMASIGVYLVIPESLQHAREAEYGGHANVLSFREFCFGCIKPHLTTWKREIRRFRAVQLRS